MVARSVRIPDLTKKREAENRYSGVDLLVNILAMVLDGASST